MSSVSGIEVMCCENVFDLGALDGLMLLLVRFMSFPFRRAVNKNVLLFVEKVAGDECGLVSKTENMYTVTVINSIKLLMYRSTPSSFCLFSLYPSVNVLALSDDL